MNDPQMTVPSLTVPQRLWDLVRQQRMELFEADLITQDEYAALAVDHAAVERLETYDGLRQRIAQLQADAMIAHRWFAKHFGEIMNGRDFVTKCEMAEPMMADYNSSQQTVQDLKAKVYTLRERNSELLQQVDALLGDPDAVHLGAQAAVTALRQCQATAAERDELRSQLAKRTFERDDASQSCDVMQAERDRALSELAKLKKDKK